MKNLRFALLGALLSVGSVWAEESCSLSLAGAWKATLSDGRSQVVRLPGSISEQGLGNAIALDTPWTLSLRPGWRAAWPEVVAHPENVKMPFFLTPSRHYVGKVVFTRTIDVPDAAKGRLAELFLERAHWCSVVFVDGVEKGRGEALSAPQKISLGELTPGRHELRLEIDNAIHAINPGINAHSISDHIAGNWNGAIGRLAIDFRARDEIASVKLTPDRATRTLIAEVRALEAAQGRVRAIACSSDEAGGWEMKNACDGDPATIWHTRWKNGKDPEPPHWIAFTLRRESKLKGVTVSGRLDGNANGLVKACRVETSLDGKTWRVAAETTLAKTAKAQTIPFSRPVNARFVKFTALSVHVGPWAHLAEFDVVE